MYDFKLSRIIPAPHQLQHQRTTDNKHSPLNNHNILKKSDRIGQNMFHSHLFIIK